jgi:hypothetical protein
MMGIEEYTVEGEGLGDEEKRHEVWGMVRDCKGVGRV